MDELLTSQNAEETIQILKKFGDNSLFGRDVLDLRKKVDEKQKEIDRQQIEIDKLKAEKAALEAEKRKKDNRRRYHFNGIQRNSSPPQKKRSIINKSLISHKFCWDGLAYVGFIL